ncbi:MAG: hypothetical protein LUE11_04820 [Clostridia bacterium]|nr:hypothetical protein [Clostridia bacterium]
MTKQIIIGAATIVATAAITAGVYNTAYNAGNNAGQNYQARIDTEQLAVEREYTQSKADATYDDGCIYTIDNLHVYEDIENPGCMYISVDYNDGTALERFGVPVEHLYN